MSAFSDVFGAFKQVILLQSRMDQLDARMTRTASDIDGLTEAMLVVLGQNKIKTIDDLGDLATDELVAKRDGILKAFGLSDDDGNRIIMAARAHWFDDDAKPDNAGEVAPADVPE